MNLDEWRSGGSFLDIDGLRIFYRREGNGRESTLCLHGFPTASYDYHKVWKPLSERLDLVAFDMVGYGFSSKPRNWGYTTFDQVDVLQALLKKLEIKRVHILATIMGIRSRRSCLREMQKAGSSSRSRRSAFSTERCFRKRTGRSLLKSS